jgi:tripartite-type tricarboxylate transporter receptor subunit TctC
MPILSMLKRLRLACYPRRKMMMQFAARAVCAAFAISVGVDANAQPRTANPQYPIKPVRMLVGFQPGGGSDLLARLVGPKLTDRLGQPFVIDNRSGAGGTIAMEITAKAPPDGYTLLVVSGSGMTNAALFTKVSYDLLKAFAPISQMTSEPYILLAHPSLPANTVKEVIALAKARPGGLTCGSSGTGSFAHLGIELFNSMAGVRLVHVPYKGSGAALIDLLGGQINMTFASAISATPQIKTGRVRAIAVTSAKRSRLFPDLPTISEAGVPGYEVLSWYGLVAPRGTPDGIIRKLNSEIAGALAAPESRANLANSGAEPAPGTPQELGAKIDGEIRKWTKVVREAGIRLD